MLQTFLLQLFPTQGHIILTSCPCAQKYKLCRHSHMHAWFLLHLHSKKFISGKQYLSIHFMVPWVLEVPLLLLHEVKGVFLHAISNLYIFA